MYAGYVISEAVRSAGLLTYSFFALLESKIAGYMMKPTGQNPSIERFLLAAKPISAL